MASGRYGIAGVVELLTAMKSFSIFVLVLSFTAAPVSTPVAAGQRAVVIRIDDIQDHAEKPSLTDPEFTVLHYHLDNRIPALLSIIAGKFGTNQRLIDLIRIGLKAGIFEIGIHGWYHDAVTNQSETQQMNDIKRAENSFSSIFGIRVLALVPPSGRYNQATIEAMHATGLTLLSASVVESGVHPGDVVNGIAYFPETVRTAEVNATSKSWVIVPMQSVTSQISGSWAAYGLAVAVMHPRQFVDVAGKWSEEKWNSYIQMVEWVKANQGSFVLPKPSVPKEQSNLNPLFIPVALVFGITSSIMMPLIVGVKGKRNRKSVSRLSGPKAPDVSKAASPSSEEARNHFETGTAVGDKQEASRPYDAIQKD